MSGLRINVERMRARFETLATFGGTPDGGVNRPSFSEADLQARRWLREEMSLLGMEAYIDAVGNVIGRWTPTGLENAARKPALACGSHLDSVPYGGAFDGALGVVAALECATTLIDAGAAGALRDFQFPIEVIAFSEEEGRFGGMLGSQAMTGQVVRDWFHSATSDDGQLLTEAMRNAGFDPGEYRQAQRSAAEFEAFLELHIEQGPVLESRGLPVGVVTGIAGTLNWDVTLLGEANHSGTTPMEMRKDAFLGLSMFGAAIPGILKQAGAASSRITVGHVALHPNFSHSVPGRADFSLNCRDCDEEVMLSLGEACRAKLHEVAATCRLQLQINEKSCLAPAPCSDSIVATIARASQKVLSEGTDALLMPSGAGHDTQFLSTITKTGMIFVPSIGGVSHAPEERSDWGPIELGTNVLLQTLLELGLAA